MEELQAQVISAVVAAVGAVFAWLLAKLRVYLEARIENETVERVLSRLTEAVDVGVREVAARMAADVKTAANGKIAPREAELLRARAKQAIFTQLSLVDRRKLEQLFEARQLQEKLDQQIEAAVQRMKEGQRSV